MLRVGRFCHALVYGNHVFQPTRLLADRSALLAHLLAPIVHDTAYEAFREISPLLGSRSGLSTAEAPMADVAAKLAELVAIQ